MPLWKTKEKSNSAFCMVYFVLQGDISTKFQLLVSDQNSEYVRKIFSSKPDFEAFKRFFKYFPIKTDIKFLIPYSQRAENSESY